MVAYAFYASVLSTDIEHSYIVDFRDCITVNRSDVEALWDFRLRWQGWQLSEDRGPSQLMA